MTNGLTLPPKVSIIMPVYNGGKFLKTAVESIRKQTYVNYELIVIDDGSDDNTWEELSYYAKIDSRIVLLRNKKNRGITDSLITGLKIARGEYIARQDADDISLSCRLEKQNNYLDLNDDTVLVSCGLYKIDFQGNIINQYDLACDAIFIEWHLLFFNYLRGHSQVMFRREAAEKAGGYNEYFKYAQDYDLWTRLLKYGQINILSDKLLKHRFHRASISHRKTSSQLSFALEVAQNQLNRTTNNAFTLSDIEQLWSFWTVTDLKGKYFTNNKVLIRLHRNLTLALEGFANHKNGLSLKNIAQIKKLIAERYIKWSILILMSGYPIYASICMMIYALKWTGFRLIPIIADISKQLYQKYTDKNYQSMTNI